MNLWIVLITLFTSTPAATLPGLALPEPGSEENPIRYRGIDQLLAKFDAEADGG